jgi:hypothetical protein
MEKKMPQNIDIEQLKYPIGRYIYPDNVDEQIITEWINEIEDLPGHLKSVVNGLSENQLNTPYRPGGWTARQVIHHISDSHMNSLARFKWAITEDKPAIKPYNEKLWAQQADYTLMPVEDSLSLIVLLHKKITILLRSLDENQLNRIFIHPEMGEVVVKWNIGLYAWHGKHHVAHIRLVSGS